MKYKKTIITALTSLLAATSAVAGGGNVGNGGMAYVCYGATRPDGTRVIRSAELLDFWEARQGAYRLTIDLGPNNPDKTDLHEKIEIALSRLSKFAPQRADLYRKRLQFFNSMSAQVTGAFIDKTFDATIILKPKHPECEITNVVYQVKSPSPDQVKFLIDSEIYEKLSSTDQAGLWLHEVAYWTEIEKTANHSDGVRNIVRMISSKQVLERDRERNLYDLSMYTLLDEAVEFGSQIVSLKSIRVKQPGVYSAAIIENSTKPEKINFLGQIRDLLCRGVYTLNTVDGDSFCSIGRITLKPEVYFDFMNAPLSQSPQKLMGRLILKEKLSFRLPVLSSDATITFLGNENDPISGVFVLNTDGTVSTHEILNPELVKNSMSLGGFNFHNELYRLPTHYDAFKQFDLFNVNNKLKLSSRSFDLTLMKDNVLDNLTTTDESSWAKINEQKVNIPEGSKLFFKDQKLFGVHFVTTYYNESQSVKNLVTQLTRSNELTKLIENRKYVLSHIELHPNGNLRLLRIISDRAGSTEKGPEVEIQKKRVKILNYSITNLFFDPYGKFIYSEASLQ